MPSAHNRSTRGYLTGRTCAHQCVSIAPISLRTAWFSVGHASWLESATYFYGLTGQKNKPSLLLHLSSMSTAFLFLPFLLWEVAPSALSRSSPPLSISVVDDLAPSWGEGGTAQGPHKQGTSWLTRGICRLSTSTIPRVFIGNNVSWMRLWGTCWSPWSY